MPENTWNFTMEIEKYTKNVDTQLKHISKHFGASKPKHPVPNKGQSLPVQ